MFRPRRNLRQLRKPAALPVVANPAATGASTDSDDAPPPSWARSRGVLFVLVCVTSVVVAAGYVAWAAVRDDPADWAATGAAASLALADNAPPTVLFQNSTGEQLNRVGLMPLADPDGPRSLTPLSCARLHFAAGRGLCLRSDDGYFAAPYAYVFGTDFEVQHKLALSGFPSRARVAPDGRYGATTVFVTGHSYAEAGFSTETTLIDLASGTKLGTLEEFAVQRDGARFASPDFNFWGVTFANDSNRFFATLATGGQTFLVEGDVGARKMRVLRENVECPSLSPDNTRLAFKKRVGGEMGGTIWRFHVLDLATMAETPLAEERSIDDQIEWLDDHQVLYGETGSLWTTPADGSGEPRRFMSQASSPAVVRSALRSTTGSALALPPTDLAVAVSASAKHVEIGEALTYTVIVTNHGPVEATQLRVDYVLEADATIGVPSSVNPQYGCAVRGEERRVTCDTPVLPSAASWTISFTVTPTTPGPIGSRSIVSGAQPDPNPGNDSATTETSVGEGH
jgi:uncharacterized repeat protein (TIGR01451 family)